MPNEITHLQPSKTYIDESRARKAVAKLNTNCRHFLTYNREGRVYVVFVGEQALRDGLHFSGHICVS